MMKQDETILLFRFFRNVEIFRNVEKDAPIDKDAQIS